MKSTVSRFLINLGILIAGLFTIFSGLLIQVNYHFRHFENIATNDRVWGITYSGWSVIHKISIVMLLMMMLFHVSQHGKWYKMVWSKRLWGKNRQVLTLSVIFFLVVVTGMIPWGIDLLKGDAILRKTWIEIHDKLALVGSVYLILHVMKRLKWFVATFEKIRQEHQAHSHRS